MRPPMHREVSSACRLTAWAAVGLFLERAAEPCRPSPRSYKGFRRPPTPTARPSASPCAMSAERPRRSRPRARRRSCGRGGRLTHTLRLSAAPRSKPDESTWTRRTRLKGVLGCGSLAHADRCGPARAERRRQNRRLHGSPASPRHGESTTRRVFGPPRRIYDTASLRHGGSSTGVTRAGRRVRGRRLRRRRWRLRAHP